MTALQISIRSEMVTRSERCALIVWSNLKRDGYRAKTYSRLVQGSTANGRKDFHLHYVYSEVSKEVLMNYAQAASDIFPLMFASNPFIIQAVDSTLVSNLVSAKT